MPYSSTSKRLVQIVTALGSSLAPFMVGSIVVAAPTIGEDLSADVALLGWLTAGFFLVAAACLVPFGRIADVKGAKKVFAIGLAIYVASGLLSAVAPNIGLLIVARGLTGVGAAMIFGTSVALLGLVFDSDQRGKAIGINVTAMFIGFTLGLLAGGFLSYYVGWRSIFVMVSLVAGLDLLLVLLRLKGECELVRRKGYDGAGMVLYASGIVLLLLGLALVDGPIGLGMMVGGVGILALFLIWERRRSAPLIQRAVSSNIRIRSALLGNLLFQGGSFAVPFTLSLFLQYVTEVDSRYASFILITPQILMVALGPFSGRLNDRMGSPYVAALGCLLNAIGLSLVLGIDEGTSVEQTVIALLFLGAGTAFFMPSILSWALKDVERANIGVASALTETSRLGGMALSNAIIIVLFTAFIGASVVDEGAIPDFIGAVQTIFLVFLALTALGLAVAIWSGRRFAEASTG